MHFKPKIGRAAPSLLILVLVLKKKDLYQKQLYSNIIRIFLLFTKENCKQRERRQ